MYARTADIKVDDYSIENGEPIDADTATVSILHAWKYLWVKV